MSVTKGRKRLLEETKQRLEEQREYLRVLTAEKRKIIARVLDRTLEEGLAGRGPLGDDIYILLRTIEALEFDESEQVQLSYASAKLLTTPLPPPLERAMESIARSVPPDLLSPRDELLEKLRVAFGKLPFVVLDFLNAECDDPDCQIHHPKDEKDDEARINILNKLAKLEQVVTGDKPPSDDECDDDYDDGEEADTKNEADKADTAGASQGTAAKSN